MSFSHYVESHLKAWLHKRYPPDARSRSSPPRSSRAQIAQAMSINHSSVGTVVSQIFRILEVRTVFEVGRKARALELLSEGS